MRTQKEFHKNPHTRDFVIATSRRIKIYGDKRAFPEDKSCEICHYKLKKKLDYHHWDDTQPIKGLWVCGWCHSKIHEFEKNGCIDDRGRFSWKDYLKKYILLKKEIDAGKNRITEKRRQMLLNHKKIMEHAVAGVL